MTTAVFTLPPAWRLRLYVHVHGSNGWVQRLRVKITVCACDAVTMATRTCVATGEGLYWNRVLHERTVVLP